MRRLACWAGVVLLAATVLASSAAQAHPMNVAYADVTVREREVAIVSSVNLFELDLVLALDKDKDGTVDAEEIAAAQPRLVDYLRSHLVVTSRGVPLPLAPGALRVGRAADGRAVLEVEATFQSGEALADVSIQCDLLSDLGSGHHTLARVGRAGRIEEVVLKPGAAYRLAGTGSGGGVSQFLLLGVLHIFTGLDHVLFLLGLLLVSASLVEVLPIVTSFTVAHSVTLSLAALGAVSLPPKLVESGIALSIAYVALENLLRRDLGRRWLVSLCFGLVHGFGFASVLSELHLPRRGLVSALLAFNVGVELGQIAIVLLIVPLLRLIRRSSAYRPLVTSASALILVMGIVWLFQRAL